MIADLTQSIDSRQKDLQNGTSFAAIRLAQRLENIHKKCPFKRTPRYRRRVGGLSKHLQLLYTGNIIIRAWNRHGA